MLELWGVSISSDTFSMVLDGLLLLVMAALWWMWWQQARQRKQVETKLGEAATQLQEATKMLDEALQHMTRLQTGESAVEIESQVIMKDDIDDIDDMDDMDDDGQLSFSTQSRAMSEAYKKSDRSYGSHKTKLVNQVSESVGQSPQSARILRMQREGESVESIAGKMNIPLAQVKLILMLQKSQ